jgi:hypothetical protein
MRINNKLGKPQYFTAQVECIAKPGLLPFLCGKGLDRLQVKVIVKVKVVHVLPVDKEIQHIVALAANLKTGLHPIDLRCLEELCVPKQFK